jgi:GT2 family glycosyltransferase
MQFTFIAVNFNGAEHTANYLKSLAKMSIPQGDAVEAIIVDNNSADDDLERVKRAIDQTPGARLVALDHNPGYFKGLNEGIAACHRDEHTMLIVGNNDLIFDTQFVSNLKNIEFDDDVMVIAPDVTTLDGRRQNPHVLHRVSTLAKIKARIYYSNYYVARAGKLVSDAARSLTRALLPKSSTQKCSAAPGQMRIKRGIGACYVLTPNFFRHYQRLDDRVFLWGEEALLSHQIDIVNGSTLYSPSIKVIHCESASVGSMGNRNRYEIVRSSYRIYREYL